MKIIPEEFNKLKKTIFKSIDYKIHEDHNVISLTNFQCQNKDILEQIIKFINLIHKKKMGICIFSGEVYREININKVHFDEIKDDILSLTIKKTSKNGFYYFLTLNGFKKALTEEDFIYSSRFVWIEYNFKSFSSITTIFSTWGSEKNIEAYSWKGLTDSRKLVRDLTTVSNVCVPHDIRPYILRPDQDLESSEVFDCWKIFSTKNLILTLPSEVDCTSDHDEVIFKGEKFKRVSLISLADKEYLNIFELFHDCAQWVYLNLQDAETKHTLLNYHLAFEWVGKEEWPNHNYLKNAFISAKEAFKLHLQKSGRELLEAFNEIKKSLHEEVNRVCNNTRGLITNFWRDFSISAAVLVLKFITDNNQMSQNGIKIIYGAISSFLFVSLSITIIINARFHNITKDNRNKWYQRLYPFIDKSNLEELVNKPILKSIRTYNYTVIVTVLIYIIIIAYLLNSAFSILK